MKALLEISFKPYAMTDDKSQGRIDPDKSSKDDFRTQFQHDRDRINFSGEEADLVIQMPATS